MKLADKQKYMDVSCVAMRGLEMFEKSPGGAGPRRRGTKKWGTQSVNLIKRISI